MRTTINLPDSLLTQAKRAALDRGTTLTEFIADALRLALARKKARAKSEVPPLPVFTPAPGKEGFQPGVDLDNSAALQDLMDEADGLIRR
ncbi:MAG: DUF2191 domain-containing protein [Acidobacteria bacterium]|nr:DUF2191 domain-containing protein [Acidobacteriota bacterium]MCL5286495.1 DUF2191 domain-containing protein [Acidobacteriota bacterium]MCL5287784.1 DUF2191 domain-containing protein [Acidobacteriota bacterium]